MADTAHLNPEEGRKARYMIERTFPDGLQISITDEGAGLPSVVRPNGDIGVRWVHSYVSEDKRRTFCVYDGPDDESIRKAAALNGLPVDRMIPVSVLDPYFYR